MGKYRYGVVLDAGSSGTRVHIYRWLKAAVARALDDPADLHRLPAVKTKNKKWTMKVHPGISTFAGRADLVGPEHLRELFEFALDVVPSGEAADTPIFLLATAGMRLLDDLPREALLREACAYAKANTPFKLGGCGEHFQIISGETEGLFGWIAANYLVGGFDKPEHHIHSDDHTTYGFLDMGGASAQIAFAPNSTETQKHANDLQLLRMRNVDGTPLEYRVFVTTFLGYGANEARRRYVEDLQQMFQTDELHRELPDPCLPAGLTLTKDLTIIKPSSPEEQGTEMYLLGTGNFKWCVAATYKLLDKGAVCVDEPCLFHGVHVPAIDFNINHFIGVSNFWHGTHEIFEMGYKDRAYDFATYQKRVSEFCSADWSTLSHRLAEHEWGDGVGEEEAAEACFKAAWIINVLHEGIGVPRVGLEALSTSSSPSSNGTTDLLEAAQQQGYLAPFQAVNKIDDTEVEWTLGKMLLYASSQVPPADPRMLDVGFGTNDPANPLVLPLDFQRGGSEPDIFKPVFDLGDYGFDDAEEEDDDDDDDDDADEQTQSATTPPPPPSAPPIDHVPSSQPPAPPPISASPPVVIPDDDVDATDAFSATPSNWRSKLLHAADGSGRTPGYVLFGCILVLACVLLMGRERRAAAARRLFGPFRRDSRKIRLGGGPKYERLLEAGELGGAGRELGDRDMPSPTQFELSRFEGPAGGADDDDERSSNGSATSSRSAARGTRRRGDGAVTPRRD